MLQWLLTFILMISTTTAYTQPDSLSKDNKNWLTDKSHLGSIHKPEQGPPGPTGPTGPTGPVGPNALTDASFLSVFTKTNPAGGVPSHSPVVFDQLAIPVQGTAFTYNNTTGAVTFNQTGFYLVTYGVSVPPAEPFFIPEFEVVLTPGGIVSGSEASISDDNYLSTVSIILEVTSVGQTLTIENGLSISSSIGAPSSTSEPSVFAFLTVEQMPF
jgi:hypothetical protein